MLIMVGFNFCVVENGANFEVQAVYKADTTCMLRLDDSNDLLTIKFLLKS